MPGKSLCEYAINHQMPANADHVPMKLIANTFNQTYIIHLLYRTSKKHFESEELM